MDEVRAVAWWEYVQEVPRDVRKCRVLLRLLFDCHNLKSCKIRYGEELENHYCERCNYRQVESIEHVLFTCPGTVDLRRRLWEDVSTNCPQALYNELMVMTVEERTSFLLFGLGQYTREWQALYSAIVSYVYTLYISRK